MKMYFTLLLEMAYLMLCESDHLIIGDSSNKDMVFHLVAKFPALLMKRRVENIFYSNPDLKKIKSVLLYDNLHSDATATITAGGVGYTFINIRLKSAKGRRIDFDIGIYA